MNTDYTENNWYALYTRSRAEKKVFEQLIKAGIEAYLPLRKTLRQWSDRKKWVETPMISSYIFVKLSNDNIRDVYDVHGVVAFVNDKGKPAVIPSYQIEAMQRTIDSKLSFSVEHSRIEKGQNIRVTSGPLIGIEGKISDVQGSKKLIIQINHIGYTLIVELGNASIESISKEAV